MLDTMTLTKLTGGLCGALLVFLLGKWVAEIIYHPAHHGGDDHAAGYVVETGEGEATAEAEEEVSFADLYAAADADKGKKVFNKCKACHKLEDGANGTGPYLYGVVGRPVDGAAGFGYSGSLAAVVETWTPEELDKFITNPAGFAPGTTMAFAGVKKAEDRANLIAFLAQNGG